MKRFVVINRSTGYHEEFGKLSVAKKAMKENNATGYIYKHTRDEIIPMGEISLTASNKTFLANSRQSVKSYT